MSVYKTWIEINKEAISHNFNFFRERVGEETKLWAVVKSNAYGHGLVDFSVIINESGVDGFCADSVMEGLALRGIGIKKPILILGPTMPELYQEAEKNDLTITISNFEALKCLLILEHPPKFHLKIDTGMRRQGFYLNDLSQVIEEFRISNFEFRNHLEGVYTHFASAKDVNYPTYTEKQFAEFLEAVKILEAAGFSNLIKHTAATGGVLVNKKYHLDAVRIGIGFYGLWPSKELKIQLDGELVPVLSWKSIVSEVKDFKKGDYFGYDLVEKASNDGRLAIVPIGYWHGIDRRLSGCGEVLICGKRAKILGRVSMDLIIVDVTDIDCRVGDEVVIIGEQGGERISAGDIARKIGTVHYEVITRINPLIKRINV